VINDSSGVEWEFSAKLMEQMAALTPKQRAAIPQIVRRLAEGGSLSSLLSSGPKRRNMPEPSEAICAWNTYYRRPRGWAHNEKFRAALAQARQEYERILLQTAVQDSADELRRTTLLATACLRQEIAAVVKAQQGEDVQPEEMLLPQRTLVELMEDARETSSVKLRAADRLMRNEERAQDRAIKASLGVLDRADIQTAVKSAAGEGAEFRALLEELQGLGDEEDSEDESEEATDE
jgi:hypothetical protein